MRRRQRVLFENVGFALTLLLLTACGEEFYRGTSGSLAAGLGASGEEGATAAANAEAGPQALAVSESSDSRLEFFADFDKLPIVSQKPFSFSTTVSFPAYGSATEAKLRGNLVQNIEVATAAGEVVHRNRKSGGSAEWELPDLGPGLFEISVAVTPPNDDFKALNYPETLKVSYEIDLTGPKLSVAHNLGSPESLVGGLLQGRLTVKSEQNDIGSCEPAKIFLKGGSTENPLYQFPLESQPDGSWATAALSLEAGFTGASEVGKQVPAPQERYVVQVSCADVAGNATEQSESISASPIAAQLNVAFSDGGHVPLEGTNVLGFLQGDKLSVDLKLLADATAESLPPELLTNYAQKLKVVHASFDPLFNEKGLEAEGVTLLPWAETVELIVSREADGASYHHVGLVYEEPDARAQIVSMQKIAVYRDTTPLELTPSGVASRQKVAADATLEATFSYAPAGAPLVDPVVESTADNQTWQVVETATVSRQTSSSTYLVQFPSPTAEEGPLRVRVRGKDASGQEVLSPLSRPLTLRADLADVPLLAEGGNVPECASSLLAEQSAPRILQMSRLVCHETATTLETAPYVRVLVGIQNQSAVPFAVDEAQDISFRVVNSDGLTQSLNLLLPSLNGKAHADGAVKLLLPLSTSLLGADRVWIEWDADTSGFFQSPAVCPAPAAGRPSLLIQDKSAGETPLFDPLGC